MTRPELARAIEEHGGLKIVRPTPDGILYEFNDRVSRLASAEEHRSLMEWYEFEERESERMSHTYRDGDWRFHYNSDLSGEVIVTNTSEPDFVATVPVDALRRWLDHADPSVVKGRLTAAWEKEHGWSASIVVNYGADIDRLRGIDGGIVSLRPWAPHADLDDDA